MSADDFTRREFLKSILAGISVGAIDWNAFPVASKRIMPDNQFDAIIIGAGLGGLSCGAAFARQGFKPLVIEQHIKPGGYATTFQRKDFIFDVSLHSTVVGERSGFRNLIYGFPEITDVLFVPHPELYRAIYPHHDIRVPQCDVGGYVATLSKLFPEEEEGIKGAIDDMRGLSGDVRRISSAKGQLNPATFATDYPFLARFMNGTWAQMVDTRIRDPKLKAILCAQWVYYGLPPSQISPFYSALPAIGYLEGGGYYPVGRSQKISDALTGFIRSHGGTVKLGMRVREIVTKDGAAVGVRTAGGEEYTSRVVVSNADARETFVTMLQKEPSLQEYAQKLEPLGSSLACFQVFLGLKRDLVREIGIKDSEVFAFAGYDMDEEYRQMRDADLSGGGFALAMYDNLPEAFSPKGKNTLNILALQGYDHWQKYEADYFRGSKSAYNTEKEEMADVLIDAVEKRLLPGLREAIEVKEIGTPLTNVRYTSNYHGAIYGWDQTPQNSGQKRVSHTTPLKNLYLAGAWTRPGHGYGGVIGSGLECFGEIMKNGSW
jgi:all-trans-retinol 13,14-reductase